MKKFFVLSMMLLFSAGIASAAVNNGFAPSWNPRPFDNGGPDSYGYYWADNDGGGGPTYNWVDISARGVAVTGLTDDNNVGPFSFGFNFPYYWYTVNHCWIGSNGYIEFLTNTNYAHPFADIPLAAAPNDYLAVLAGDLDFSRGNPSCYYYTNNADSFVVSWINVGEFGYIDSLHTFQVILCATDSSITYQYGANHGQFLDSSSGNETTIGIENVNGQVGVQYLRENLPANHLWHDGLALRFHPVPNPQFVVHDFGVVDGMNDGSGAPLFQNNVAFTPRGYFKNFGNQPENNLVVRCQIRRGTTTVYNVSDTIPHMEPGEQAWVEFAPTYTPSQIGTFKITWSAVLSGDQNSNNNSKITEVDVYSLPQELAYCDSSAETARSWTGDFSGFGLEYNVPQPISITRASFYVGSVAAAGPAYVWFFPDNGSGHPDLDHPVAGDTVDIALGDSARWKNVPFSDPNLHFDANATFYLVVLHALENTFQFGMDQTVPLSNRGWEYTGGMAPDRDRTVSDVMFKIQAQLYTSVDEGTQPTSFSLSQNYPNPFNARTNISFSLVKDSDVKIDIYNIAGQLVDVISGSYHAGDNMVTWDGNHVSSGVYFYKLNVGNASETRKMVLVK
jgi:hypothetical protein